MPTQQQQHHSEACQKFRISGLTPNLLNQDQHLSKVPWDICEHKKSKQHWSKPETRARALPLSLRAGLVLEDENDALIHLWVKNICYSFSPSLAFRPFIKELT